MTIILCLLAILADPLPRPADWVPENPPLQPMAITAGGQRLLLGDAPVTVRWDPAARQVTVDPPGWWVINYPLDEIAGLEGRSRDEVAHLLFGRRASELRNWYLRSGGVAPPEPDQPAGPAPIRPSQGEAFVVDARHPDAADTNPGTVAAPLRTIGAAVGRLQPGSLVRVRPGIYRESVKVEASGTAAAPIVIEGERDGAGRMPVITGNDPFPAGAWSRCEAWPGVWRADLFTGLLGGVGLDGEALIERSLPHELEPGQFCLNRGSDAFLELWPEGVPDPLPGDRHRGTAWRQVVADDDGYLDLGAAEGGAVGWLSSWVWVDPRPREGTVWDPRFPEPINGQLEIGGAFRAARQTGSAMAAQVNKYRVWVNGERLPGVVNCRLDEDAIRGPRPDRNYGQSDRWDSFALREGWNHLVFQFDTTRRPADHRFRFGLVRGLAGYRCRATRPPDLTQPPDGELTDHLATAMALGPLPAAARPSVFVRLPGDASPEGADLDLAARSNSLLEVTGDFVQVRGLEFRGGAQFQQRAQVTLSGQGVLLEGCLCRDSEVRGITFAATGDRDSAPLVIRGNWVVNPGNTGIGGTGASDRLTAENLNGPHPGRSPVVIEHNRISGANWAAIRPFWESGAMKLFRLTGAVIRYNTVTGGWGPCIWLDWEHYGNRLEGNRFLGGWAFGTGIEASPGPNLVCNNLTVDLRPGQVWFRWAHLSWSSDRNWVLHNTVDGRWNPTLTWQNKTGGDGIYLQEGGDDRKTRWAALTGRVQTIVNNVVVGCHRAVREREPDLVAGNLTDRGSGAPEVGEARLFVDPEALDYRPLEGSPLLTAGQRVGPVALVRHDHDGLLRHPDDPPVVGAFRPRRPAVPAGQTAWELELVDGTMLRSVPPRQ